MLAPGDTSIDTKGTSASRNRLAAEVSALAAAGAPVVAVAPDGGTVLWATPAGLGLFGLTADTALPVRLDSERLPVRRFAELSAGLAPVEGQRLERFRLPSGRRLDLVTLACRRVPGDDGPALLLLIGQAPKGGTGGRPVPDLAPLLPSPAAPLPAEASAEALVARAGGRPFLRFIWRTDAAGAFTSVTPDLEAAIGAVSPRVGEDWAALLSRGVADPADAVAAAFAAGVTFTGLDVLWPLADGRHAVSVALSGVPVPAADRSAAGYRGFGLMRLTSLRSVAPETGDADEGPQAGPETPADTVAAGEPAADADVRPEPGLQDDGQQDHGRQDPVLPKPLPQEVLPQESLLEEPVLPDPVLQEPAVEASDDIVDLAEARQELLDQPPNQPPSSVVPFAQVRGSARAQMGDQKVVPLRAATPSARPALSDEGRGLSRSERHAFREIARALGARVEGDEEGEAASAAKTTAPGAPAASGSPAPVAPADGSAPAIPPEVEAALEAAALAESRALAGALAQWPYASSAEAETELPATGPGPGAAPAAPPDDEPLRAVPDGSAVASAMAGEPPEPATPGPVPEPAREPEPVSELARHAEALFDRLPVGLLVCRGEVPIVMNRTLLDLLGWDTIDDFYRDGGLPRLFRGRGTDAIPPGQEGTTVALSTRDGEIVAVDARIQSLQWNDLPATLMTFRRAADVELTPRLKSAELELRRREAEARELRAILDTATDGVIVLDEDGRILSINRSGEALFGYDQREVAGETFISLLAPDSHATALDYLEGLKSHGVASVLNDGREVIGRVRQGGRIPLFMTLGAVSREPEVRFCAVLRDITPWKKAESDLTEAKRVAEAASSQKSDFLAKISHEIRTPLSAIIGFAEVMIEERFGPVGNERYLEYLRDIHASGGHVISLVNDLLDLSKIEAGRFDLAFVSVDVNEIVSRSVSLMQPQASTGRVVVRTALAARLPRIVADERSLRQIVLNLLSNAVKFTDPGGQVIVSTALTDRGEVAIRVRDTGIGMSEKDIETALEPFRQLATARRSGGTGLGLPLTKALVEANRAALTIRSAKDSGTLVEVLFPTNRVLAE
ncbi:MAG: ATP-binding protein [Burkholderiales bacterium]|nr:ATP-binding protein [Burkholderiales bacterium]